MKEVRCAEPNGDRLIRGDIRLLMASCQQQDWCTDNHKSPLHVRGHGFTRATEDIHLSTFRKLGFGSDLGTAADAKHPNLTRVSCKLAIWIGAVVLSGTVPKRIRQTAADTQPFAFGMPNRNSPLIAID